MNISEVAEGFEPRAGAIPSLRVEPRALAHSLVSVLGNGVGYFMTHDHGQPCLVLSDGQNARIDRHFPPAYAQAFDCWCCLR